MNSVCIIAYLFLSLLVRDGDGILCHKCYKFGCRLSFSTNETVREDSIKACDGNTCLVVFIRGTVMRMCGAEARELISRVPHCDVALPNTPLCQCTTDLCNRIDSLPLTINSAAQLNKTVDSTHSPQSMLGIYNSSSDTTNIYNSSLETTERYNSSLETMERHNSSLETTDIYNSSSQTTEAKVDDTWSTAMFWKTLSLFKFW